MALRAIAFATLWRYDTDDNQTNNTSIQFITNINDEYYTSNLPFAVFNEPTSITPRFSSIWFYLSCYCFVFRFVLWWQASNTSENRLRSFTKRKETFLPRVSVTVNCPMVNGNLIFCFTIDANKHICTSDRVARLNFNALPQDCATLLSLSYCSTMRVNTKNNNSVDYILKSYSSLQQCELTWRKTIQKSFFSIYVRSPFGCLMNNLSPYRLHQFSTQFSSTVIKKWPMRRLQKWFRLLYTSIQLNCVPTALSFTSVSCPVWHLVIFGSNVTHTQTTPFHTCTNASWQLWLLFWKKKIIMFSTKKFTATHTSQSIRHNGSSTIGNY